MTDIRPVHSRTLSDSDEKIDNKTDDVVVSVNDLENGGAAPQYGDVIPEGVDPDLLRNEQVVRGLKQRHIQVGA
ncbi:hypothetical protein IAU60_001917 [Kwoniella sp. DSM 27419]